MYQPLHPLRKEPEVGGGLGVDLGAAEKRTYGGVEVQLQAYSVFGIMQW